MARKSHKKIRKPKLHRYPKRPMASASLSVWERYNQKCAEVEKLNAQKMKEYHHAVAQHEKDKKHKEHIMKATHGMNGIALGKCHGVKKSKHLSGRRKY